MIRHALAKCLNKLSSIIFNRKETFVTSSTLAKKYLYSSHLLYPTHLEHLAALKLSEKDRVVRHAGIICTIGPASRDVETLVALMSHGMDIARLNFAHGNHEEHLETINNIRKANYIFAEREERATLIGIAVDIQGAAIRTGNLRQSLGNKVELKTGKEVLLTTDAKYENDVTDSTVYVNYEKMPKIVSPGSTIFLDDGLIQLNVIEIEGSNIRCRITYGNVLGNTKGVNLPGIDIDLPTLSQKDVSDIKFALENKVDMIFASFIRDKEGIEEIRSLIGQGDRAYEMSVIAKIENQQGLAKVDEILAASDGLMVARGDLGVELPAEKIFIAQKAMVAKYFPKAKSAIEDVLMTRFLTNVHRSYPRDDENEAGKPVICATQMLDSMINKPKPTRAETSDIANAVIDGVDCVMLSAETAIGKYPVECVKVMAKALREAEVAIPYKQIFLEISKMMHPPTPVAYSTAFAAVAAAEKVLASAILTSTATGKTAFILAKLRPSCSIIAITPHGIVARKCNLYKGVIPVLHRGKPLPDWDRDVELKVKNGLLTAHQMGYVHEGDTVIVLTGWKAGRGMTNTMKITLVTKEHLA